MPNQVVGDSVEIRGSVLDNDLLALKVGYRSADSDDLLLIASDNQPQPPLHFGRLENPSFTRW